MSKYALAITSRPVYPGPEERSFSELQELTLLADFTDDTEYDNTFTVGIVSDFARYLESGEYFNSKEYLGNLSVAGQQVVRHNIQVFPQCGFFGSFFQYQITKKVPVDGNFKFLGARGWAAPMNVDQEFLVPMNAITAAT